jgi:hypothetical protein
MCFVIATSVDGNDDDGNDNNSNLQIAVLELLLCLNNERNLMVGCERSTRRPSFDN